jgi:hypothetical protein|tara:strand:+ start:798 stop:1070 length:273 start_codon:yes stop_codon:yes gene_type:complete
MSNIIIIKTFAKKWKLEEQAVNTIYIIIGQQARRYGKVSRFLRGLNIHLSPRALKYFYHRIRLAERINEKKLGRPKNYSNLLRNERLNWE